MAKKINGFDYETLVQEALRKVVKETLQNVSKNGLPDDHHFYITFDTCHSGADIPDYLREEYPEEMTIVLQHEFWDLNVDDDGMQVTLCFDDANERIEIPFDSLVSFVDPSVKFGLQFTPIERKAAKASKEKKAKDKTPSKESLKDLDSTSNVVSIDSFRKR